MFITHLKLKNWRNFRNAEVDFQDITYIMGPNAAGKSNFLDVEFPWGDVKSKMSGSKKQSEDFD